MSANSWDESNELNSSIICYNDATVTIH